MAEKKVEVFYQPKGEEAWRRIESGVEKRPSAHQVARQEARVLLEEGEEAAARAIASRAVSASPASSPRSERTLTPAEVFERDMARAIGAWERYVGVEMRRIWREAAGAFDRDRDRKG